jgi:hypothetical protein
VAGNFELGKLSRPSGQGYTLMPMSLEHRSMYSPDAACHMARL